MTGSEQDGKDDDYVLDTWRYSILNPPELTEEQKKDRDCKYLYDELTTGMECMKDYMIELAGNLDKDSREYRVLSAAYWSLKGALEGVDESRRAYNDRGADHAAE